MYHDDNLMKNYQSWKRDGSGSFGSFPFGAFAYARLDEQLNDEPDWKAATREE
jgi:hypothetical protein